MGINLPDLPGDEWYLPVKDKKLLYSKKYMIPVGGKTDVVADENDTPEDVVARRRRRCASWACSFAFNFAVFECVNQIDVVAGAGAVSRVRAGACKFARQHPHVGH